MELFFDFENRRAIFIDDGDKDRMSFITVEDFTKVIVQAVEFEGEWPVVGGIRGTDISIGNLITLGEKVRGMLSPPSHDRINPKKLISIYRIRWLEIPSGKSQGARPSGRIVEYLLGPEDRSCFNSPRADRRFLENRLRRNITSDSRWGLFCFGRVESLATKLSANSY